MQDTLYTLNGRYTDSAILNWQTRDGLCMSRFSLAISCSGIWASSTKLKTPPHRQHKRMGLQTATRLTQRRTKKKKRSRRERRWRGSVLKRNDWRKSG